MRGKGKIRWRVLLFIGKAIVLISVQHATLGACWAAVHHAASIVILKINVRIVVFSHICCFHSADFGTLFLVHDVFVKRRCQSFTTLKSM